MRYVNNVNTMQVTRSFAMSGEGAQGAMICVRGDAIGQMLVLPNDRKMVVGRDSSICDLTLDNPKVSRKHLEITYIDMLKKYRVLDYSTNGTYVSEQIRLRKNHEYYLEPSTELWLGSRETRYKLR